MQLADKVTLLVGGSVGIGEGIAWNFTREGAKVVIADINAEKGGKLADDIRAAGGQVAFIRTDVSSMADLDAMTRFAIDTFGRIDVYWHNAGIANLSNIEQLTEQDYDKVMAVNLKAAVFGTKFVVPDMKRNGGGSIIFTSSVSGLRPSPLGSISYSLSKAGLVMLVRNLAVYLGKYRIRVNAIAPWGVWTDMTETSLRKGNFEENSRNFLSKMPLGEFLSVDDIANAGVFLASDKASNITGVCLPVDGGLATI